MTDFEPLKVESLKKACIKKLEGLILSGDLKMGEKLPSERKLATLLNISRPVLHEALVDLHAKGLITILARKGVYVNDFRTQGSCAILDSLLDYSNGSMETGFVRSLMDMRLLIECETARLAASQSGNGHTIEDLTHINQQEREASKADVSRLTELDFQFHLFIAIASGNLIYSLIMNSFKGVYTSMTGLFFSQHANDDIIDETHEYHTRLIDSIKEKDPEKSIKVMTELLKHGEINLQTDTIIGRRLSL